MLAIDKNRPSHEWIESLRARFPCEKEIDRILTRKLLRRAGPPFTPVSLETLIEGTQALLRSKLKDDFTISEARWLSGGASKLQMAFKLDWNQPGVGRTTTPLVLRMEPSESNCESSRLREFQVIKAVEGVVPVPPTYWYDADGEFYPYPAMIYGFADGVAKPSSSDSNVTGLGIFFPPALREPIGGDFVDHMARFHSCDWRKADLSAFEKPGPGTQAIEWELNHWERVWEEDSNEDIPLMRLAMSWLRANMPALDHVSIVHGDYRTGNFLFTEHNNRISALLDWEMGHLGDRHLDLAWATNTTLGHMAEDGKTFLCGGFFPREEFFARYERASGLKVIPESLIYYDIFGAYKIVVLCMAAAYRVPRNGKSHQDVLLAWLIGISYSILEGLRLKLETVV
jgi:aminoglycoside phosphotransferase (APT) family kinase protein